MREVAEARGEAAVRALREVERATVRASTELSDGHRREALMCLEGVGDILAPR